MSDRPSRPDNDLSPPQVVTFDAVMPAALAARAEESGVKRASSDPLTILVLSVLGGAFVALGAIFATTVTAGNAAITAPDGAAALSAGLGRALERLPQGLFGVGGERAQRRDPQHAKRWRGASARSLASGRGHNKRLLIDPFAERSAPCRERLASARRRVDQAALACPVGVPDVALKRERRPAPRRKPVLEPHGDGFPGASPAIS